MLAGLLDHARLYLGLGFAVLPLHFPFAREGRLECSCGREDCRQPAKHPFGRLVRNGLKDASKDPATVEGWFTKTRFNIAIATGAPSGVIVLDIDPRHGGDETLANLEREHGNLPATWRFLTGGGGEHVLFRQPGRSVANSAGALGPGIDVRGDGGYIVAPPSLHICGRPTPSRSTTIPRTCHSPTRPPGCSNASPRPGRRTRPAKPPSGAPWRATAP